MAQLYYSPVTVNTGQVPSTQSDFPVLISYTDARFKTTGNGGHVANTNGYDIRPYSDSALTTALTYELERYNASTGEVIMWVKRSSLADGNVTYLGYGDTSLTTDGSGTATWSNSFLRVWHVKDGSTLSLTDSTSNASSLSNTTSVTAATGKIDGGAGFTAASHQYLTNGVSEGTAMSWSCWVNATTLPAAYNATMFKNPSNGTFDGILVKSTGKLFVGITRALGGTTSYDGTGSHTLLTGTWYYLTLTYNSSAGGIAYVNASSDGTLAASGNFQNSTSGLSVGRDEGNGRWWNGVIDEVRLASVARSANWITTEYNNQSAPGTFATLGTEVATGAGATRSGWFVFF